MSKKVEVTVNKETVTRFFLEEGDLVEANHATLKCKNQGYEVADLSDAELFISGPRFL